ncbi:MAG: DUF5663 domain-containing protein [Patescibacteria group bacterium]
MFNPFSHQSAGADSLENLAEEVIKQSGLEGLPAGDHKFLKDNLIAQLERRLGQIMAANLGEDGLADYEQLLAEGPTADPAKFEALMNKYSPNYQAKVKAGLDEFIPQMVESLRK